MTDLLADIKSSGEFALGKIREGSAEEL